jgi:hypothetical protein
MGEREELVTVKLSKSEMVGLKKLAKHYAITMSAVLRMLMKRDLDALSAQKKDGGS